MMAFTILGILVFWMFCFDVGYHGAQALDAKHGLDALVKPVHDEMATLISMLTAFQMRAGDGGGRR